MGAPTLQVEIPIGLYVQGPDGSGNMQIRSCANTSLNFSQVCTGLGGVWDVTRTPPCQLAASTMPPLNPNCASEPQFSGGVSAPTFTCGLSGSQLTNYSLSCYWDIATVTEIARSPPTAPTSVQVNASACTNNDVSGYLTCCRP